ncbi:hypothetical protein D3875_04820 [Deinococcus cavernae]|uniref:DUF4321 domain-containing protein n=1 Tax=Deinococcus cavernae TaxID=2320857 RepID=A0A418V4G6_9DEIO|nr:hypothetical protein [Deinococcus cavernae]RJF71006.1 hypothetical protein D3875_04820 [Deinococcus cavernae]
MRFIQALLMLLLVGLGLAFAALSLGTFAALTDNAPLWLRSLGSLENVLGVKLGLLGLPPFLRATVLAFVSSVLMGLAAYYKPR